MNKEIELKFGISDIPEDLDKYISLCKIKQHYIYQDEFTAIRKRKIFNLETKKYEYVYTVKTKGQIKDKNTVFEIESKIKKEQFDSITNEKNVVEKIRIKIPIHNELIAELDMYYGHLEGLITVEVEFSDVQKLKNFIKPKWFAEELEKTKFSNSKLSKMSREDFLTIMDKKELDKNIKIKNYIEKSLNIKISSK